jgi:predicted ATP-grasp superfamily ATP-dependent carboligase
VLELARELGKRLGYVGHAGIEFRWDNRNNEYKYIELNPRIPGEVGFDQACGLPTVWNSYLVALGRENTCSGRAQKQGLAFHDMRRDILTMRAERKPVNEILRVQLAMLFRRTSGRYFAWDDIKPGVVELTRFLRHLFRLSFRKLTRQDSSSKATRRPSSL